MSDSTLAAVILLDDAYHATVQGHAPSNGAEHVATDDDAANQIPQDNARDLYWFDPFARTWVMSTARPADL